MSLTTDMLKLAKEITADDAVFDLAKELAKQATTGNVRWVTSKGDVKGNRFTLIAEEIRHDDETASSVYGELTKRGDLELVVESWNSETDEEWEVGKKTFRKFDFNDLRQVVKWLKSLEFELSGSW